MLTLLLAGPGAKILLNNATLHLKRGKRYGLCGPNGVGKSTLMRSIANGQLDGFPPKEVRHCARSVFLPQPSQILCALLPSLRRDGLSVLRSYAVTENCTKTLRVCADRICDVEVIMLSTCQKSCHA